MAEHGRLSKFRLFTSFDLCIAAIAMTMTSMIMEWIDCSNKNSFNYDKFYFSIVLNN